MGLASTAPALLRAVRAETDPAVLAAVVRAVAARQWEPASTGGIVELRLWARAYAEKHPELRRTSSTSPLLPGVAGAVPPPSLDPSRANEFRTRQDQVPDLPHGSDEPGGRLPPEDLDRMSPVRVLVTGAGGPAGVAVIRALRARGHHVIALDADPSAVGLRLAAEHHVVPRADDPHYLAALLRVATISDAQALICTVAEEYRALSGARDYLLEAGLRTLMPPLTRRRAVHRQVGVLQPPRRRRLPGAGHRPGQRRGRARSVDRQAAVRPRVARRDAVHHPHPAGQRAAPGARPDRADRAGRHGVHLRRARRPHRCDRGRSRRAGGPRREVASRSRARRSRTPR